MSDLDDDDVPQLSSHALAALQEFYAEKKQCAYPGGDDKYNVGRIEENWTAKTHHCALTKMWEKGSSVANHQKTLLPPKSSEAEALHTTSMEDFPPALLYAKRESEQLSQFWYSQETALRLAKEVTAAAGEGGRVACVSTPSVYQKLRELHREDLAVYLFEYDRRFSIYGEEFIFYDYNNPLDFPVNIAHHSFDIVIADPPYLSEECLRKTSETIKYLTQGKILLCTGAVMEEEATKLLGVKTCKFIPKHTRTLANEFRCYVNYDSQLDHDV